ncbi:sulfonate transport system substrate-binding protein [Mumia flava]|uniref:Sulfonate transport system substrate-binding protein n=1 Tax=Mumia flava TaxID=1348852 RepID=A0A0B2BV29_9ACTN|nr:aliphatic sulfonate ABC transporter substrate-binding protein [Mumia flava]PJJ58162.1 sulfonate transport system substrate-binding protein [Mumia flava]
MKHRPSSPVIVALAAGLALVALAALTGCTSASGDDATRTLNVGQLGATKIEEALLEASGEADDLPYEIEWSLYPAGGPAFLEAVPSGSVDVASMADTPPIFGQVAGIGTKIVAVEESTAPDTSTVEILAAPGSGIDSVADLKGKKVATTEATILQYTLVRALEEAGLSYDDIEPVPLAPPDAAAAFASGDVDAVTALDPQRAQMVAEGAQVIGDGVGTTSGYSVVVATDAALADEQRAADVEDFVQRLARAQAWAVENPDAWLPVYTEVSGLPADIAEAVLEREGSRYVPIDDTVIAQQQEQADAYHRLGLIEEKLDVSAQFDDRFNDVLTGAGS